MAEPRLTAIDQCIANAALLILCEGPTREAAVIEYVADILPRASLTHPVFGPVAEALRDLQRLHARRDLNPATRGKRGRECSDQLRRVLVAFLLWRLQRALGQVAPADTGRAA